MTPTQRTTQVLRDSDLTYEITEKWNPFAKRKQDLFGFIDILVSDGTAIQATTMDHRTKRLYKIQKLEKATEWLKGGNTIELWSWRKIKNRWKVRIDSLVLGSDGQIHDMHISGDDKYKYNLKDREQA
jgi:hypothetical protein